MRTVFWKVVVLMALSAACWGVTPIPGESARARDWVAASLAGEGTAPFSFIYGGRASAELLPSWRQEVSRQQAKGKTTIRHTWTDPRTALEVACTATCWADFPAVEWRLDLTNRGTADTPILEDILPLDAVWPCRRAVLHHALGDSNSARSFAPLTDVLKPGAEMRLAPNGGRSSDGNLPFFNLQTDQAGVVIAVGWSGQWEARFAREGEGARTRAGMQTTHLLLHPGESIRTPSILLVFWEGPDPLRGNNLLRQVLLAHYLPRRNGELVLPPICGSVTETDPNGDYEGPHLRAMPILAARGVEVFWSDMDPQQWYPIGFPEGTGTWEPDPAKYPHGLAPIGQAAHQAGLGYLLWFEPERVHFGTAIARLHPEWVMRPQGEWSQLFDLGNPRARAWLTDYVDVQISAARLDWLRWDFNIEPLGFWRRAEAPDRQGMAEIRHIEGLYAMWDDLLRRHPGLVVDNCASGGRRIDLETLQRGLPLWHSDLQCFGPNPAAEQLQNGALTRWVPLHGCAAFGYEPSYAFRSAMTAGNILATNVTAPESAADLKRTVATYHNVRPFLLGDFYPLFPHREGERVWYGYQAHRPDLGEGIAVVFRRSQCAQAVQVLALREVDPEVTYLVWQEGESRQRRVSGKELARYRLEIADRPGSVILHYRRLR